MGEDAELAKFYGMVANIDENVGRLIEHLDRVGCLDDTLVIFMTDNGTARGATFSDYRGNAGMLQSGYNAGMRGRKGSPYEGGHRVPCFLRWPAGGIRGGRTLDQLTAHLDLMPTLIDLCGLRRPPGLTLDGVSLASLLTGATESVGERTLFAHHQELPLPEKYRFGCAMRGAWRLISRTDLGPTPQFELYDMATDPGQTRDLGRRHPDVAGQLRSAYDRWWSGLQSTFEEDAAVVIGDPRQNPTRLTCFSWHGSRRWQQANIREADVQNGPWVVDVARAGRYTVRLRRWPAELDLPITAAAEGSRMIQVVEAKLQIGDVEMTRPVGPDDRSVSFTLVLAAGRTRLQTWLIGPGGKSRGAYYAYVERLD